MPASSFRSKGFPCGLLATLVWLCPPRPLVLSINTPQRGQCWPSVGVPCCSCHQWPRTRWLKPLPFWALQVQNGSRCSKHCFPKESGLWGRVSECWWSGTHTGCGIAALQSLAYFSSHLGDCLVTLISSVFLHIDIIIQINTWWYDNASFSVCNEIVYKAPLGV